MPQALLLPTFELLNIVKAQWQASFNCLLRPCSSSFTKAVTASADFMGPQVFYENPENVCPHEVAGVCKFCHAQRARDDLYCGPGLYGQLSSLSMCPRPDGEWEYYSSFVKSTNTWKLGVKT
ncbi:hypothetical protein DER46DRAFT_120727 [Fusarium sp. MPI-SDFR-AT-0072]|nr:hypothetical protein DER46DRAFT_120727 [Fusarium sp. MPI-SDFR-AT-0072]